MSETKHYKIFIDGQGFDAVGYQIAPVYFNLEKPNGELMYFPWQNIQSVRLDKHWLALLKKRRADEERQRNPAIEIPSPSVIPFTERASKK